MKNRSLLPIVFLSTFCMIGSTALAACTQQSEKSQYAVEITNKAELQAAWFVGDSQRSVTPTLTPEGNALVELNEGNLSVSSSAPTVVEVTGLALTPVAVGKAVITVNFHGAKDTVEVEVKENSAQARYGTAHAGTAADPFTNEDALLVAKSADYAANKVDYYVTGEVASWYHRPKERTNDSAVSYFLKPAQAGGEQFEVYKCVGPKDDAGKNTKLTDEDIWIGGTATAFGKFTVYSGQCETDGATFVSCTGGTKPGAQQTVSDKTFAQVLAEGVSYPDGHSSYDKYKVTGYVSAKEGNNFYMTATKGEALVKGKADEAHSGGDIYTNAIQLYFPKAAAADIAAKLLDGAKIEATFQLKNYHGIVRNCFDLTKDDIDVKEAGVAWNIPEPTVATKTLAEFLAAENTKAVAYNVTAQIKAFKSNATKDAYGNMTITDGTNDLVIYGSSATETALAWDKASSYVFTNPQDFLKNTTSQALAVGNTITMKLIRSDYTKDGVTTKQGQGIITNVVAVATTAIALDKTTAELEVGDTLTLTATRTPANSNTPCEWISSDETKATVEGGIVTAKAAGTVKITAKISDSIKAECNITVKASTATSLVLDKVGTGVATDYVTEDTEYTLNGYVMVYNGAKKQGDSILLNKDKSAFLYNKTAMPKSIKSVKLTTNTGASGTCKYAIAFSATPFTARTEGTNSTTVAAETTQEYQCSVANALYFCVTVANKNGQVLKLEIIFND